mmetsp:Transcript_5200/g.19460  ORF Transcript_5200/g.19460 Transcript_5200/m.19460 type:complete len:313 (-) Transcript_5200:1597-2535(-)
MSSKSTRSSAAHSALSNPVSLIPFCSSEARCALDPAVFTSEFTNSTNARAGVNAFFAWFWRLGGLSLVATQFFSPNPVAFSRVKALTTSLSTRRRASHERTHMASKKYAARSPPSHPVSPAGKPPDTGAGPASCEYKTCVSKPSLSFSSPPPACLRIAPAAALYTRAKSVSKRRAREARTAAMVGAETPFSFSGSGSFSVDSPVSIADVVVSSVSVAVSAPSSRRGGDALTATTRDWITEAKTGLGFDGIFSPVFSPFSFAGVEVPLPVPVGFDTDDDAPVLFVSAVAAKTSSSSISETRAASFSFWFFSEK